jgi:uncharacterized protein (TIRG00374 family)
MGVYRRAAARRRGLAELARQPSPTAVATVASETPAAPGQVRVSWSKFAIRLVLSLGILAALFTQISPARLLENLRAVSPAFVLFAWCYYALCQWISSYRWQLLLSAKGVHVSLSQLFAYYMIGMFVNNFMPGSVGGDVVKSYRLFRRTKEMEIAVVSVFLERFTGLLGLCLISIFALAFGYRHLDSPMVLGAVVAAIAALLLMVAVLWLLPVLVRRFEWLGRFVPAKVRQVAGGVYEALISYRHELPTLGVTIAVSVVLQLMFAAYYAIASVAMGIPIPFVYFVLFLPLVTIVGLLPFSIGGLGIREVVMVALFAGVGIAKEDVLAVVLTVQIINTVLSLWGGLLLLKRPAEVALPRRDGLGEGSLS